MRSIINYKDTHNQRVYKDYNNIKNNKHIFYRSITLNEYSMYCET